MVFSCFFVHVSGMTRSSPGFMRQLVPGTGIPLIIGDSGFLFTVPEIGAGYTGLQQPVHLLAPGRHG
jgi:hypothetical protein